MYKSFTPIFEFQITPSNFQNFDRNLITQTVFTSLAVACHAKELFNYRAREVPRVRNVPLDVIVSINLTTAES